MKKLVLFSMMWLCLSGCKDDDPSACGEGTEVQEEPLVCVFRSELIVETGFECPTSTSFRVDFGEQATVCSDTASPPFDLVETVIGEPLGCPTRCVGEVDCRQGLVTIAGDVCPENPEGEGLIGRFATRPIKEPFFVVAASGGNDDADGQPANEGPLGSIATAISRAQPGDTIYLMPRAWDGERWGSEVINFDEALQLDDETPSGEEGNPIAIESWPGTIATLEGDPVINVIGTVSEWEIGYIDLRFPTNGVRFDYESTDSHHWRFHNIDATQTDNQNSIDGAVFYFGGDRDFVGDSLDIPTNDFFVVEDSRMTGTGDGAAVAIEYARHVSISRNHISGLTAVWGSGLNGSDNAATDADYELKLEDNFLVGSDKGGFIGGNHRWVIRNNIFVGSPGIVPLRSAENTGGSFLEIINNTVVGGDIFLDSDGDVAYDSATLSRNVVTPFQDMGGSISIRFDGTLITMLSDENILSSETPFLVNGSPLSLEEWRIQTGFDSNSLFGAIEFVDSELSAPQHFELSGTSTGADSGFGADTSRITSWWIDDL